MKKSEIVQLALIVIGILIVVKTLDSLINQMGYFLRYPNNDESIIMWFSFLLAVAVIMILVSVLIIIKSEYLSKRIVQNDTESSESTTLSKSEILTISILILSMYFVISGFPSFMASLFLLGGMFFDNFKLFKEMLPKHIWGLIQYFIVVLIFLKSKSISVWIERNIMK